MLILMVIVKLSRVKLFQYMSEYLVNLFSFSCLGIDECQQIKIIENETKIQKNTLVTTLDTFPKEYKVSVEVKGTSLCPEKFCNVIHFTAGRNHANYGDQNPVIYFRSANMGYFIDIRSAVNGDASYSWKSVAKYKENEWIHIEVSQIHEPTGYNYMITINGKQEHTVMNNRAEEFYNVKCYASNPWANKQGGFIRNLFVYFKK